MFNRLEINDLNISTLCLTEDGQVIDHFGGLESLGKKEIKMHNPVAKIEANPVRILRAIRFAASLGFSIEPETLEAVVANASLLRKTDYVEDLWRLLNLNEDQKNIALDILKRTKVGQFLSFPKDNNENFATYRVECELKRIVPSGSILNIFKMGKFYLVGGSVRDIVWNKPIRDLDIKTDLTTGQIVSCLQTNDYCRTENIELLSNQYYVNKNTGTVSILIDGMDLDITHAESMDVNDIVKHGDVNFSCGIYDIRTGKIQNPQQILKINEKVLEFCDDNMARRDPLIIVNALKQISRNPDIVIPSGTDEIIRKSIPLVIKYFQENPQMRYKLVSFGGSINMGLVKELFASYEQGASMLDNYCGKKQKMVTGSRYISETIEDLSLQDKNEITKLIMRTFGDHCDLQKVFNPKVTSVVYKKEGGVITSCCLMSGERVYSPVASNGQNWVEMVADLVTHNYNVWVTVEASNLKMQALTKMSGLKAESNPQIIKKILQYNDGKDPQQIMVSRENGVLVFRKEGSEDYPQILFRS